MCLWAMMCDNRDGEVNKNVVRDGEANKNVVLGGGMLHNKILARKKRNKWDSYDSNTELDEKRAFKLRKFEDEMVPNRSLKCRRFEDEMVPNLFQAADPAKFELLVEWVSSRDRTHELRLCGFLISDPMTFFREAFNSRMWLSADHVDIAMALLRERQVKYPTSFGRFNRAILDSNFHELLKTGTIDIVEGFVEGNVFEHGKKWNGCTHLYYPVCTRKHWIAVEVVFSESTLFVYDCDHNVIETSDLEEDLHLASILIPKLAKLADISMQDTLRIIRVDGLPRQPEPGDCGVYTIKYIEFLAIEESTDRVDDQHMLMWRKKLTVDLFNQNCDP